MSISYTSVKTPYLLGKPTKLFMSEIIQYPRFYFRRLQKNN